MASVLSSTYPDFELVVSDNANTDETGEIISSFQADPRLRHIRLETPVSVTQNWNVAFEASGGDYILMLGDDDCLLPGYFETMAGVLADHGNPECVVYNAYSYVFQESVDANAGSYYREAHFRFDSDFEPGVLPTTLRRALVRDMFRFRVRYPLNMQLTLVSRQAATRIFGGMFRPPFPDHYAIASLLLTARSFIYHPERLLVVGLSPKSFGHFVYNGRPEHGMRYLGSDSSFPGKLPGNELLNAMTVWLRLLLSEYPELLPHVSISRADYVRRQVYAWYLEARLGFIKRRDLLARLKLLRAGDWVGLLSTVADRHSWSRAVRFYRHRRDRVQVRWSGLRPLSGVNGIADFAQWVTSRRSQGEVLEGVTPGERSLPTAGRRALSGQLSAQAPLVTICVPTIGRGSLRETLESVARQSYENYEVLILDNASGPDIRGTIDAYLERETRAQLLRCERRLPMFENFARGAAAARGRYLTFFHDDDVYLPRFVERHVDLLQADREIAFTGSNWTVIDERGELLRRRMLIRRTAVWPGHRYILAVLRAGVNIVGMPAVVFRSSLLSPETFTRYRHPGYSDFILLMRMAEGRRVGLIDESLMQIRSHGSQESRVLPPHQAAELLRSILDDYGREFSARWPEEQRFARRMRRSAERAHRLSLLWAWLSTADDEEAKLCANSLDRRYFDRLLRHVLIGLQSTGLGRSSRRISAASAARRLGNSVLSRAL